MASFETVAKQFVDFYYTTFDTDRKQLAALYRDNSMLTFESGQQLGATNITEKLLSLPFQKVAHKIEMLDAQPTATGGIMILVIGKLLVDEEQQPLSYSQAFHLTQDSNGQYFVYNDIFRLVYG
ncbi:nuclear transport factor 2 [Parathielavia hyrcaniae]|uniref:Nuclear transport factor 2 n=1 Tax=Parathielavia hyrcaniae TaxID=113614 RepID=A0AAN6PWT3_9PEZI|nr:nuclear transport factor 2 [Parathielavia hyrcaniae]